MMTQSELDSADGKRKRKRDSLFLSATISMGDAVPLVTRVRNLSSGGMMIDAPNEMAVDTPLLAEIRGLGEIKGRIAWHTAGRAGVAFDLEIDPKLARNDVPRRVPRTTPDFLRVESARRPGLSVR